MRRDMLKKLGAVGGVAVLLILTGLGGVSAEGPAAGAGKRLPRPYEGAPPLVPHDVEARKGLCQECHSTGEQGAPITPHPTRTHFCVQCHVGQDLTVLPFDKKRARE